jgi:hypothetical protein
LVLVGKCPNRYVRVFLVNEATNFYTFGALKLFHHERTYFTIHPTITVISMLRPWWMRPKINTFNGRRQNDGDTGRCHGTAELGVSLAEMIRQNKIHIISCTGANLEEDIMNLVAHTHYKTDSKLARSYSSTGMGTT